MWGALWGWCGLGSSSLPSTEQWDGTGWAVEAEQDCVLRGRWWGLPPLGMAPTVLYPQGVSLLQVCCGESQGCTPLRLLSSF